jgi:hypothetical protein
MQIIRAEREPQYAIMEALARRIVPAFYEAFFAVETADYLVESVA